MLSLILPTYNEAENLPELLPAIEHALQGQRYEVIIVDDDSPDGTWRIAQEMAGKRPRMTVIRRVGRRGLSSAVIEGFLAAKGSVLAVMDADGQHDLRLLPKLASAVQDRRGIALGSRYMEGGSIGEWDERRAALSRMATNLAIALCKVSVTDPMSGFFAIDRATFEETLPTLNPKGFKILLDLLVHVPPSTPVTELPFAFGKRMHGESKLSRRVQLEFLEYLYDVTFGCYLPLTFVQYGIVGVIGVIVNLAIYLLASRLLAVRSDLLGLSPPLLFGIEAAILFNFLLNNAWTFARLRLRGLRAVFGFLSYNVACLFGAVANIAVTRYLFSEGLQEIPSVVFGAAVGMVWNYTMSRLFTWRS